MSIAPLGCTILVLEVGLNRQTPRETEALDAPPILIDPGGKKFGR